MDYEKRYKQLHTLISDLYPLMSEYCKEKVEGFFPELKESEDEKIRKSLIILLQHFCKGYRVPGLDFPVSYKDMLAWLEKQGERHISHDDEIMIKQLTEYFTTGHGLQNTNETVVEWLNDVKEKLEKQGEQKQEINNFDVLPGLYKCVHRMFDGTPDGRLLFEVGNVYRCLSKHDRAEFEVSYGHSVYLEDPVVCKHFIPFEKQGVQKPNPCDECINVKGCINCENGELRETEQKPAVEIKTPEESLGIDSDTYNEIVDECIYGEQKSQRMISAEAKEAMYDKPSDKVEPKFKVGDWVVYYRNDSSREVLQVYDIRDGRYYFTDNVHFSWSVKECDEKSHLWTIQDAKEGDVLACENGWTCIFKCLNDNLFSSYCFMDHEGWFCEDGGQGHTLDNRICGEIYPATNEQCDTLIKAMADAGYTFDFDKRELKKIEQKSAEWSEEDEKKFADACIMLDWYKGNNWWTAQYIKDWLKSLKDRYTWKPSDAQMASIICAVRKMKESACYDSELVSLLNDLKKLREE